MSSVSPSQSASNVGSRDDGVSVSAFDSRFQELLALMTKPPAWVENGSAPAQKEFLGTVRAGFLCLERAVLGQSELSCRSDSDGGLYLSETSVSLLSSQVRRRRRRVRRWDPGCCYLAAIAPKSREEVQRLLGSNPPLASLMRLGFDKFQPREVIERLRVSVDNGLAHVHASGKYLLVHVFARAAAVGKYGAGTLQAEVSSWKISAGFVPTVDSVGGVAREWLREVLPGTRFSVDGGVAGKRVSVAALETLLEEVPSQLSGLVEAGDSVVASSVAPASARCAEAVESVLVRAGFSKFFQHGVLRQYTIPRVFALRTVPFFDEDGLSRRIEEFCEQVRGGSGAAMPFQIQLDTGGVECVTVAVSVNGGAVWWSGPGACILRVPDGVTAITARGAACAGTEVVLLANSFVNLSIDQNGREEGAVELLKVLMWCVS